ncbi:MAG: LacI family DNA-binding transcriptional regulator [Oscillospiraceae bacterium]
MAVTIKDVAREANTSVSTVSKVMNNSYDVSQATAERVRAIALRMNYHPNVRAQNFAKGASKTILFLTHLERNIGFSNPHMFEILSGVEETLRAKGYKLIIQSATQQEACDIISEAAAQQSADGVIIHAAVVTKQLDKIVSETMFPHTVIGIPAFPSHMCWIDSNNRLAGEMAARHLLQKGYKRIAFIGGAKEDEITQHRLYGMLTIFDEFGIKAEQGYIKHGDSTCKSGFNLANELLSMKQRPDAIICANNYIAYGCVSGLQANHINIPKDIAVITFDDFPFSQVLFPQLSVVNIDVYDIGQQAGKLILSKIKKPNLYVQSYTTLPSLIEREST